MTYLVAAYTAAVIILGGYLAWSLSILRRLSRGRSGKS
jgi:hypothetical protein